MKLFKNFIGYIFLKNCKIISSLVSLENKIIICLRLQIYMNNYCGPISAANLWVRLEKWKVSAVKTTEDDPLVVEMYVECVKL